MRCLDELMVFMKFFKSQKMEENASSKTVLERRNGARDSAEEWQHSRSQRDVRTPLEEIEGNFIWLSLVLLTWRLSSERDADYKDRTSKAYVTKHESKETWIFPDFLLDCHEV